MTIRIITISPTGREVSTFTFSNSIDAAAERKLFDEAGIDYRVEWDCK